MDKQVIDIYKQLKKLGVSPQKFIDYCEYQDWEEIFKTPQNLEEGIAISAELYTKEQAVELCKTFQMQDWGCYEDECFVEEDFRRGYVRKPEVGDDPDWTWKITKDVPNGVQYSVWWATA